ncbi:hypothetical protein M2G70_07315 [Vibrio vulnificus]|nr:hypothetical protein [Vibrio vulnificus]
MRIQIVNEETKKKLIELVNQNDKKTSPTEMVNYLISLAYEAKQKQSN